MKFKPMLAEDFVEEKLRFPVFMQPKIDGVRALNIEGGLLGRSLKPHRNKFTTKLYSLMQFGGLDGEMAAAHECDEALCRKTSSALSTIEGEPYTLWWLFDNVTRETVTLRYAERYQTLVHRFEALCESNPIARTHLRLMPNYLVEDYSVALKLEEQWLDQGYEGVIIRDPNGYFKQGRSTVKEGGLLRIKRFVEEEAWVIDVVEGEMNGNEATVNELGKTKRSTHAAGMTPNGMVGTLICSKTPVPLFASETFNVSAGSMPHDDRKRFFAQPELIKGKQIKYKHFPKGVKDKPRFPTFQSIITSSDR